MKKSIVNSLAAVALSSAVLMPGSAYAYGWLEKSALSYFTNSDWESLRSTARSALDNGEDGVEHSWNNESTGHEGSVTPLNTYQEDGLTCRKTKFYNSARSATGTQTHRLCKQADGKWKISP